MQSMIRKALLALVAVLALGVVASASASAATCTGTVEKGTIALCSEGKEVLGETAVISSGEAQDDSFTPDPGGGWGELGCNVNSTTGHFNATTKKLELAGVVMTSSGCYDSEPGCTVEPLIYDGGEGKGKGPGLLATITSTGELTFGVTGKRFTDLYVKDEGGSELCRAGTWEVKGTEKCELREGTVESVTHWLWCGQFGSALITKPFGSQSNMDLAQKIQLTSGKKWSLYKA